MFEPYIVEFIKIRVKAKKVFWVHHPCILQDNYIPKEYILLSYDRYEVIEKLQAENYLPTFLVYATYDKDRFHIIFSLDKEGDNVRVLSAYRPNLTYDWDITGKTRKKIMKCHICSGTMMQTKTDLPFKLTNRKTIVLNQVAVFQCVNCNQFLYENAIREQAEADIKLAEAQEAAALAMAAVQKPS